LQTGAVLVAGIAIVLSTAIASAHPPAMSDTAVRQQVIAESIAAYHATCHPCACPYNTMRNGRSAYSRLGAAVPLCYERDVSAGMIAAWRQRHPHQ
jgi:hypothetical protein